LVEHTFLSRLPKLCHVFRVVLTFSLVCWAWVMFRAENLAQALTIWANIAQIPVELFEYLRLVISEGVPFDPFKASGLTWLARPSGKLSLMPVYAFVLTASYLIVSYRVRRADDGLVFASWGGAYRWSAYFFALVCILLLGRFGGAPFIYFQF
jgi:hypothetical protein